MKTIDFWPVSRQLPMIGFGCGRLTSQIGRRQSSKLIETALALGIRYFDCAPSYGEGTAESLLGDVIGGDENIVIATKYGLPRPRYNYWRNAIRAPIRRLFQVAPRLNRRFTSRSNHPMDEWSSANHHFVFDELVRSLEKSLSLLRRESVDVFLAHDPAQVELVPSTAIAFQKIVDLGLAKSFGAGIGAASENRFDFGQVWQSCWDERQEYSNRATQFNIFHGLVKFNTRKSVYPTGHDLETCLREFSARNPTAMAIVSASTPLRLKEIIAVANNLP